jgi:hypothetical protein
VDQAPLVLFRNWIPIAAAEEADAVGVLEVVHGVRIAAKLPDIGLHGAAILLASEDQFLFALALRLNEGRGQGLHQSDGNEGREQRKHEQQVAAFGTVRRLGAGRHESLVLLEILLHAR